MSTSTLDLHRDDYEPQTLPSSDSVNRYWDQWLGVRAAKLTPGEFCLSRADEQIVTVVGSSLSVCIRDRDQQFVGMTHFMLPTAGLSSLDYRARRLAEDYGYFAMTNLLNALSSEGCTNDGLEAYLVGGGTVWESRAACAEDTVVFARKYLAREGVAVAGEFIGTSLPRKVYFTGRRGMPDVRVLNEYTSTIKYREEVYLRKLFAQWMLAPRIDGGCFS